MPESVKRRSYESPRRREQARATRSAVLVAARDLFIERGYGATTIEQIAARAEVSPETVYAAFKNKRTILARTIDLSIVGDDAPVPVLDRGWVRQMQDEPDPDARLRILARNGRLMLERWTPLYEVLRGAAAADPEIASLWELNKRQRSDGQRALLRILIDRTPLRDDLSPRAAADILFAIGSPEVYRLLVIDRGWSADRFERWYLDALTRLLLPSPGA